METRNASFARNMSANYELYRAKDYIGNLFIGKVRFKQEYTEVRCRVVFRSKICSPKHGDCEVKVSSQSTKFEFNVFCIIHLNGHNF